MTFALILLRHQTVLSSELECQYLLSSFHTSNGELVFEEAYTCEGGLSEECSSIKNEIQGISKNHMKDKSRQEVEMIMITSQKLGKIPKGLGYLLPNLEVLRLPFCEIETVKKADLEQFPYLSVFYLSFNRLKTIPSDLFYYTPNMKSVGLEANQIATIGNHFFRNLKRLTSIFIKHNPCTKKTNLDPKNVRGWRIAISKTCYPDRRNLESDETRRVKTIKVTQESSKTSSIKVGHSGKHETKSEGGKKKKKIKKVKKKKKLQSTKKPETTTQEIKAAETELVEEDSDLEIIESHTDESEEETTTTREIMKPSAFNHKIEITSVEIADLGNVTEVVDTEMDTEEDGEDNETTETEETTKNETTITETTEKQTTELMTKTENETNEPETTKEQTSEEETTGEESIQEQETKSVTTMDVETTTELASNEAATKTLKESTSKAPEIEKPIAFHETSQECQEKFEFVKRSKHAENEDLNNDESLFQHDEDEKFTGSKKLRHKSSIKHVPRDKNYQSTTTRVVKIIKNNHKRSGDYDF